LNRNGKLSVYDNGWNFDFYTKIQNSFLQQNKKAIEIQERHLIFDKKFLFISVRD
jgi:hypothetical protein